MPVGPGCDCLLCHDDNCIPGYAYSCEKDNFHYNYRCVGGTPGDFDHDGDVDLDDFAGFPGCMTGPNNGPYEPHCETFDFETDSDVDLQDFAAFQGVYTGEIENGKWKIENAGRCLRGYESRADPQKVKDLSASTKQLMANG